jgi:NUMOD3 motif
MPTGVYVRTAAHRAAHQGKSHSPETRAKISAASRGRSLSPEAQREARLVL